MRSLLDFIVRHSHVFLFILLEAVSLVLLFGFNDRQKLAFMTSANSISGTMFDWRAGMESYFSLKKENEMLVAENSRLHGRLLELADSAVAYQAALLGNGTVMAARVIDNSVRKDDNYITINRGSTDGVGKGMGVYGSTGVVGVVMLSGRHNSIVLPVLNGKSSISCKVKGGGSFGFLEWKGGDPYHAVLTDIPYHSDVKAGDTIVTSGYSSVFPEGIPVGYVDAVEPSANGYWLKVSVLLAADMGNLGWVYVYARRPDPELEELKESIPK